MQERDRVSIHTLISAAHIVVHDLASKDKCGTGGAFLLDGAQLTQWGFEPQGFKRAIKRAETFFKHAREDNNPDGTETLSEIETQAVFYSAIHCYRRLVEEKSELMGLMLMWLSFQYPLTLTVETREKLAPIIKGSVNFSRPEFFHKCRPLALAF